MKQKTHPKINHNTLLPPTSLLFDTSNINTNHNQDSEEVANKLHTILQDFKIKGKLVGYKTGPTITLHQLKLDPGIRANNIIGLSADIARCLEISSARIAQISQKNLLGIELINKNRQLITLKQLIENREFVKSKMCLPIALGVDIGGNLILRDLVDMPHLMISGTTGSGKSVFLHALITSVLYKHTHKTCRVIMIDPKMLELSIYDGIPHLLSKVATEAGIAAQILRWCVNEMEDRYRKISKTNTRNLYDYNKISKDKMPYIVIIIDELADLMSSLRGKNVQEFENNLQRLAQKARAAGIHIVLSTQRPSVDVLSGVIKANFPTRITFQLASDVDRRVICGRRNGAEHLIGYGDALFMEPGKQEIRTQAGFISNDEVINIVKYLSKQNHTENMSEQIQFEEKIESLDITEQDDIYRQAIEIAQSSDKLSISMLQRKLSIGFPRAGRIYDRLIEEGFTKR